MSDFIHYTGDFSKEYMNFTDIQRHRITGYQELAYSFWSGGVHYFALVNEISVVDSYRGSSVLPMWGAVQALLSAGTGSEINPEFLSEYADYGYAHFSLGMTQDGICFLIWHDLVSMKDLDRQCIGDFSAVFYGIRQPVVNLDSHFHLSGMTNEFGEYQFLGKDYYDRKQNYYTSNYTIEESQHLTPDPLYVDEKHLQFVDSMRRAGIRGLLSGSGSSKMIRNFRITNGLSTIHYGIRQYFFTNLGFVFQNLTGSWHFMFYSSPTVFPYNPDSSVQLLDGFYYFRIGSCLLSPYVSSHKVFQVSDITVRILQLIHSAVLCLDCDGESRFTGDGSAAKRIAKGEAVSVFRELVRAEGQQTASEGGSISKSASAAMSMEQEEKRFLEAARRWDNASKSGRGIPCAFRNKEAFTRKAAELDSLPIKTDAVLKFQEYFASVLREGTL